MNRFNVFMHNYFFNVKKIEQVFKIHMPLGLSLLAAIFAKPIAANDAKPIATYSAKSHSCYVSANSVSEIAAKIAFIKM